MMSRTMSGPLARHASRLRLPRNSTWLAMAAVAVLAVGVIVRLNTTRGLSVPAHGEATGPPPAPSPPPQPAQPRPETGAPRKGTIQSTPAIDDRANLLTRRGGERTVGDKTFRLVAGEWIDTAYDSLAGLDVVSVTTADERVQLLRRMPVLVPYSALGNRVTVVVANVVYRFDTTAP